MQDRRNRRREERLHRELERVFGLGEDVFRLIDVFLRHDRRQGAEDGRGLGLSGTPGEGPRHEGEFPLVEDLGGPLRVNLSDADNRVVVTDHLALGLAFEHRDLALVGGHLAPEGPGDEDEKTDMRDDETGLAFLPGVADQGRAENVRGEEREQNRETLRAVDPFLNGRGAIGALKECRVGEHPARLPRLITASFKDARKR